MPTPQSEHDKAYAEALEVIRELLNDVDEGV